MIIVKFTFYTLMLSYNPCEIFKHLNVTEMHGLNFTDCERHDNTPQSAYIAGWCNTIPNSNEHFVFINLSRCNSDIETFGLIMHEMMHMSFDIHNDDISKEEEIITWAETESYKVFEIVNNAKKKL